MWVASVGFLAENRTYVIFSFLPVSLFGERSPATEVEAKEKRLCLGLIRSLTLGESASRPLIV